jgi:kynurenine formamidase
MALHLQLTAAGLPWRVDTSAGMSLCLPITPYATGGERGPGAFGLPPATAAPVSAGGWVGSVDAGASVNCPTVTLVPHANGTHTECVGHALPGRVTLADVPPSPSLRLGCVLSVTPEPLSDCGGDAYAPGEPGDAVVSVRALEAAVAAAAAAWPHAPAPLRPFLRGGVVVLRTLPNADSKRTAQWGGTNPPYLTPSAAAWLVGEGVHAVVVDLPSLDRENDGGALLAHRAFWGLPPTGSLAQLGPPWCGRTVTELAFVPDGVPDGPCLVELQVAPIHLDAAPSRPVVYALAPAWEEGKG